MSLDKAGCDDEAMKPRGIRHDVRYKYIGTYDHRLLAIHPHDTVDCHSILAGSSCRT
jgi:hypothetical protein